MANLKYTSVKNDCQIIFDMHSVIQRVEDDESIQSQSFNFKSIPDLLKI